MEHDLFSAWTARGLACIVFIYVIYSTMYHTRKSVITMYVLTVTYIKLQTKLRVLSPRVNYTDRATAACRRS
jgi:hypothetical protein